MKKLAIVVPSDEELWEFELSLRCFKCDEVHGAIVTSDDVKVGLATDGEYAIHDGSFQDQGNSRWHHEVYGIGAAV